MFSPITVHSAPPSFATTSDLPQGSAAFVPKDFKIDSSQTTTGQNAAGVSFVASKQDPQHPVILHEYRLKLDMRVSRVKTSSEADQWAGNVVEKTKKTTPDNLRN